MVSADETEKMEPTLSEKRVNSMLRSCLLQNARISERPNAAYQEADRDSRPRQFFDLIVSTPWAFPKPASLGIYMSWRHAADPIPASAPCDVALPLQESLPSARNFECPPEFSGKKAALSGYNELVGRLVTRAGTHAEQNDRFRHHAAILGPKSA